MNDQINGTANERDGLIRSDLNLEKWPIFTTRMKKGYREITRDVLLPDGGPQKQTIKIGLKGATETLTTEHGLLFYVLLDCWQIQGRPEDGVVKTTVNYILNRLIQTEGEVRRGNWSREWLKQKLVVMRRVPIEFGFFDRKDGKRETNISLTLLSESHIWERETAEKKERSGLSYIRIHPDIVKNLLERHVKPIRFDVIVGLTEIERILYRHLDLVMFDKLTYQRDVFQLAEELGLGAKRPDNLLSQFRKACKNLEGKNLSAGRIDLSRIERRVEGGAERNAWKIVVQKGRIVAPSPVPDTTQRSRMVEEEHEMQRVLEEEKRLMAVYDALTDSQKQKIEARRLEIQKTAYNGFISDFTTKLARLDALTETLGGDLREQERLRTSQFPASFSPKRDIESLRLEKV